MATIVPKKNKSGEIISYKVMVCVGRDEQYKQIWRTCTIKRPEGLTPAKERKEIERQADAWAEEQKAEYACTNSKEDKTKITFESFIREHWWPDHVMDGTHKPTGVTFFKYMSDDIIAYFGPRKKLSQIDAETIKRYVKFLNTEAKTQKGEPYSAESVVHHYNTLRSILEYARRFRYIPANPCQDLSSKEKPHKKAKKVDFLDADKAREFIRCLESEPLFWRAYANVLITAGLRRGEATGLQWRDIDPDKLTLSIARNVTVDKTNPNGFSVGSTKTDKTRIVPISRRVYILLMELKHEREKQLQMKLMPTMFIFSRPSNPQMPLYPTTPTRWLRRFVKKHNLPDVSPHDLRHTAATLALESGSSLKQVQELMGHADPSTTMQFYTGITEEAQRQTVEGIESLLG